MVLQGMGSQDGAAPPLHLVEEINHRVINEYTEAISTLSLAAARASGAPPHETLARAASRLRAHAEMHRALLPPAAGSVNLADYLAQICASFSKASLADAAMTISLKADDVWLDADRCWRVGLIVAELVRNAARHSLRHHAGAIAVRVEETMGQVSCLVCDNGPEVTDTQPGRGRRVVEALAAELGGSINWWFTPIGCLARLQAPLSGAGPGFQAGGEDGQTERG